MDLSVYEINGVMHFNNRPIHQMGETKGTVVYDVMEHLDDWICVAQLSEITGHKKTIVSNVMTRLKDRMKVHVEKRGRTSFFKMK